MDTVSVTLERTPYGEIDVEQPPAAFSTVGVHLGGRGIVEWTISGRRQVGRPATGQIMVIPKGQEGHLRLRGGPCSVLKIMIPNAAMAVGEGDDRHRTVAPLVDRFVATDPFVHQLALALLAEEECGGTVDRVYFDALSNALIGHLARRHSTLVIRAAASRVIQPLSHLKARRVVEYMEAHLGVEIGLEELAREAGLSVSHFGAQFRERFGKSPARYLTWLRLERARSALLSTDLSIQNIAFQVGFRSVSHFTHAFRGTYGSLPSSVRRSEAE